MKRNPLITLVTVTYNAQDTLERTLRSVEAQTYTRIEHLIIDGCSSDGTLALVQRYVERNTHPRQRNIRLVREPDKGLYDAMNKGIALAEGDYLAFLNAGDQLHDPDTIEKMVALIDWDKTRKNYAIVYGETDLVDNEGRFLRHRRLQAPKVLTSDSFRQGMLVCHQSFYVRTDLARTLPYDLQYRYSADYDWCIRLMKVAERRNLHNLNTGMVLTDYLNEGLTTQNHRKSLVERFRLMAKHYGWCMALVMHLFFLFRAVAKR